MRSQRSIIVGCVAACAIGFVSSAASQGVERVRVPAPSIGAVDDPFATASALPADHLVRYRGGAEDTTSSTNNIHGNVGGNTATDTVSGDNIIDGGAFANSAGISTVIQNSGNNVLIQNGTIVNVEFLPSGP